MTHTQSIPITMSIPRTSTEKRPNCPLYGRSKFLYLTEEVDTDDDDIEPEQNHDSDERNVVIAGETLQSGAGEVQRGISSECPESPGTNEQNQNSQNQNNQNQNNQNQNNQNEDNNEPAPSVSSRSSYYGRGRTADVERFIEKHTRRNKDLAIPEIVDFQGKIMNFLLIFKFVFLLFLNKFSTDNV